LLENYAEGIEVLGADLEVSWFRIKLLNSFKAKILFPLCKLNLDDKIQQFSVLVVAQNPTTGNEG
jgi:hypothetical protein